MFLVGDWLANFLNNKLRDCKSFGCTTKGLKGLEAYFVIYKIFCYSLSAGKHLLKKSKLMFREKSYDKIFALQNDQLLYPPDAFALHCCYIKCTQIP